MADGALNLIQQLDALKEFSSHIKSLISQQVIENRGFISKTYFLGQSKANELIQAGKDLFAMEKTFRSELGKLMSKYKNTYFYFNGNISRAKDHINFFTKVIAESESAFSVPSSLTNQQIEAAKKEYVEFHSKLRDEISKISIQLQLIDGKLKNSGLGEIAGVETQILKLMSRDFRGMLPTSPEGVNLPFILQKATKVEGKEKDILNFIAFVKDEQSAYEKKHVQIRELVQALQESLSDENIIEISKILGTAAANINSLFENIKKHYIQGREKEKAVHEAIETRQAELIKEFEAKEFKSAVGDIFNKNDMLSIVKK